MSAHSNMITFRVTMFVE